MYVCDTRMAYVPPQNSTELLAAIGPVGSSSSLSTGTPMVSTLTGSGYTCMENTYINE